MSEHFDVIIIGTGAGGGTLLHRLAPSGKRILVLERGPFLPREKDNWNYHGSFKYYSSEVMFNKDGGEIRPGFSYFVGGNTKVYGAALFRLREKDFESFRHKDGISPEWPKYRPCVGTIQNPTQGRYFARVADQVSRLGRLLHAGRGA